MLELTAILGGRIKTCRAEAYVHGLFAESYFYQNVFKNVTFT